MTLAKPTRDVLTTAIVEWHSALGDLTLQLLAVNRTPLIDLVVAAGAPDDTWMYPPARLADGGHFFGEDEWDADEYDDENRRGKVPLLSCGCTYPDCDAVLVRITRTHGEVEWSEFEVYRQELVLPLGPFRFDENAYRDALRTESTNHASPSTDLYCARVNAFRATSITDTSSPARIVEGFRKAAAASRRTADVAPSEVREEHSRLASAAEFLVAEMLERAPTTMEELAAAEQEVAAEMKARFGDLDPETTTVEAFVSRTCGPPK